MSIGTIPSVPGVCRSILSSAGVDQMLPPLPGTDYRSFLGNLTAGRIMQLRLVNRACYSRIFMALNSLQSDELVHFLHRVSPEKRLIPPSFYVYLLDKPVTQLIVAGLSNRNIEALEYLTGTIYLLTLSGEANRVTLPAISRVLSGKYITVLTLESLFEDKYKVIIDSLKLLRKMPILCSITLDQLPADFDHDLVMRLFRSVENIRLISKEERIDNLGVNYRSISSLCVKRN